jgi:tetratricopeptide (TPR) repeat protein
MFVPGSALALCLAGVRLFAAWELGFGPLRLAAILVPALVAVIWLGEAQRYSWVPAPIVDRRYELLGWIVFGLELGFLVLGVVVIRVSGLPGHLIVLWIALQQAFRKGLLRRGLRLLARLPGVGRSSRLGPLALYAEFMRLPVDEANAWAFTLHLENRSSSLVEDLIAVGDMRLVLESRGALQQGRGDALEVQRIMLLADPGVVDRLRLTAEIAELSPGDLDAVARRLSEGLAAAMRLAAPREIPFSGEYLQFLRRIFGHQRTHRSVEQTLAAALRLRRRAREAQGTTLLTLRLLRLRFYDLAVEVQRLAGGLRAVSPHHEALQFSAKLLWLVTDFPSVWPRLPREESLELMVLSAPARAGLLDWDCPLILDGRTAHEPALAFLRRKPAHIAAILRLWQDWGEDVESAAELVLRLLTRARLKRGPRLRERWLIWWTQHAGSLDRAEILTLEGVLRIQEGRIREGITRLMRATDLSPSAPYALKNLAWGFAEAGDARMCQATCARYVAAMPRDGEAALDAARILLRSGNADAAKSFLLRAVRAGSEPRRATVALGTVALFGDHPELAAPILETLLSEYPDDPPIVLLAALCRQRMGEHRSAIQLMERLLDWPSPEAEKIDVERIRVLIAASYKELGEQERARSMLAGIDPARMPDPLALDQIAGLLEELQDYDRARLFWDRALQIRLHAEDDDDAQAPSAEDPPSPIDPCDDDSWNGSEQPPQR